MKTTNTNRLTKEIKRHAITLQGAFALAALMGVSLSEVHAQQFYFDADADVSSATGGSGTWDTTSLIWRLGNSAGTLSLYPTTGQNNDAMLEGTAGTLTLSTGISVNDITVNPSPAGTYTIAGAAQTLTLNGTSQSVIDVASGSTLTISSRFAGANGFTKSNAGTLLLDMTQGTGSVIGSLAVTGGSLQAGAASANATYSTASQALRSNTVDLAVGTSLTTGATTLAGGNSDLRVGTLTGSGSITPGNTNATAVGGAINILALTSGSSSATITTGGGLNLRGGNGTTQTFTGNVTGLTGTLGVNSGATLALSGTGDSTSGVIGTTALSLRGGSITLDNSGGNTSAAAGRVANAATVAMNGGMLSLIGHSSGSAETVGSVTFNDGSHTVSVTNNGGTGAALTFSDSGSLRDSSAMTINFVGAGTGTLGTAGNNPRILFSGTPITITGGNFAPLGMFANTATGATVGFATVNGTEWAGYNATNGVIALTPTTSPTTAANLAALTDTSNALFSPTGTVTASGAVTSGALKIVPNGGTTLAMGTNTLTTSALMLAGSTDLSITGTGSFSGPATKYIHVTDANTTLSMSQLMLGSSQPITKAGPGFLNLNGLVNQLPAGSNQNINLVAGVLRGTTTTLGGSASSGGAFNTINFRGGVLEISGGGSLTRAIDLSGAAGGGGITFEGVGASTRGDGGFSGINGNASVTLVTTIGGSTAASLVWNDGAFLSNGYALTMGSTKADAVITLTNAIGLDSGAATTNYFAREIRVADNSGSTTDVARLSGIISGSTNADLLKTGAGVLELTNTANTFTGNTLIQQGTLRAAGSGGAALGTTGNVSISGGTLLLGADNQINDSANLILGGGTLDLGGLSEGSASTEGLGALILSVTSTIDYGTLDFLANDLRFRSAGARTGGAALQITDFDFGTDRLLFSTGTIGNFTATYGQGDVSFNGITGYNAISFGGGFEVVPVPEPATIFGALGLLGLVGYRERRRFFPLAQN